MIGIVGKKIGMTSVFNEQGSSLACTVVEVLSCIVTQIKTIASDGYEAIQVGAGVKKEKNTSQPLLGHFKKAATTPKAKLLEFRDYQNDIKKSISLGASISMEDIFEEGEYIDVIGTSKGKGFQGVVKRHGFSGVGDRTHGQHNRERAPGSIGGCSYPARVFKGMRMAGRMGGERVTVSNLLIIKMINDKNVILLKGATPGAKNTYLVLQK